MAMECTKKGHLFEFAGGIYYPLRRRRRGRLFGLLAPGPGVEDDRRKGYRAIFCPRCGLVGKITVFENPDLEPAGAMVMETPPPDQGENRLTASEAEKEGKG